MNEHAFAHLTVERKGALTLVGLNRPDKRNAISDALLGELDTVFSRLPEGTRAAVLHGHGGHFSAGLDLSEHRSRTAAEVMRHSQTWHRVFHQIQFCGVPVVAALRGAVIGGGLELALATHVRVAEPSAFYALPEGQRGIFVGGGATVRVARIIGADRMTEMMLTGRSYGAEDGLRLGLSHHLAADGEALGTAIHLAERVAGNAPMSNYAILNALPRISDMSITDGLFTESLVAALVQTSSDAEERMHAFLDKRAPKAGA